jgi:uncharacterized protein (DUF983 family)
VSGKAVSPRSGVTDACCLGGTGMVQLCMYAPDRVRVELQGYMFEGWLRMRNACDKCGCLRCLRCLVR